MQSAKETASNVAASARAGMEKTKATVQEKGEKMTTMDPLKKDMATAKKEERIHEAERQKQEARMHNAAAGQTGGALGGDYTTGGEYATGGGGLGLGHTPGGVGTGQTPTTGVTGTRPTTGTGGVGGVHHQDPYSGTGGGRTGY